MTDRLSFPIQPTASVIPRRRERLTDRQIVAERERERGGGGEQSQIETDRQRETETDRQRETDGQTGKSAGFELYPTRGIVVVPVADTPGGSKRTVVHIGPPHPVGGDGAEETETSKGLTDDGATFTTATVVVNVVVAALPILLFGLISALLQHFICKKR